MRILTTLLAFIWGAATMVCCTPNCSLDYTLSGINPAKFDTVIMGKKLALYTMTNESGMEVCLSNYGARIVSIMVEDRDGEFRDVSLGFDDIETYVTTRMAMGATVGRFAGRITDGRLMVDGKEYQIAINEEPSNCALHGGPDGWMNEIFEVESVESQRVVMSYKALDGENGFPGDVDIIVSYTLTDDNAIEVEYDATSSAPTVVNLTNHTFFNLDGDSTHTVVDNELRVDADYIALLDTVQLAPSGEVRSVEGTPMDLREKIVIADRIDRYDDDQLKAKEGFDHAWIFNHDRDEQRPQIYMRSPNTGITLEVYTTQPAVHIYTSNFMEEKIGRNSLPFVRRGAICFETQHARDFYELHPGGRYKYNCKYKFGVE